MTEPDRSRVTWSSASAAFRDHGAATYAHLAELATARPDMVPTGHPFAVLQTVRRAAIEGRAADPWAGDGDAFLADLQHLRSDVDDARRTGPVQLNEPQRMAHLLPGLLLAASRYPGRPLQLVEIGASAGLLLLPERYVVEYPHGTWAPPGAAVTIRSGLDVPPALLDVDLRIADRLGVDRDPVDPTAPESWDRLRAFVWPGNPDRERRLQHALAAAAADPPRIVAGDVVALLPDLLGERVSPDAVTVVVESGLSAYLPSRASLRLGLTLDSAAARGPLLLLTASGPRPDDADEPLPSRWRLVDLWARRHDDYTASDLLSERSRWMLHPL